MISPSFIIQKKHLCNNFVKHILFAKVDGTQIMFITITCKPTPPQNVYNVTMTNVETKTPKRNKCTLIIGELALYLQQWRQYHRLRITSLNMPTTSSLSSPIHGGKFSSLHHFRSFFSEIVCFLSVWFDFGRNVCNCLLNISTKFAYSFTSDSLYYLLCILDVLFQDAISLWFCC